jgi:hypothetical protein
VEALVDGAPLPPDALSALSPDERAEVAALARTGHLVRLTLQSANTAPSAEAEARSLVKAQRALESKGFPMPSDGKSVAPRPALLAWIAKLGRKQNGREGSEP